MDHFEIGFFLSTFLLSNWFFFLSQKQLENIDNNIFPLNSISKQKSYDFQVDQIKENEYEGPLYLRFEEKAILISKVRIFI